MRRQITLILTITVLAIVLAACGGGESTPEPTDIPPAADAVDPAGDLSERLVVTNADVQFNHPEGWVSTETTGIVTLGNDREAIFSAGSPDALRTGQVVMTIMTLPSVLGNDADVVTLLPANVPLGMPPGRAIDMGTEATAIDLGGKPGARMQGSDAQFTYVAYLVDVGAGRRVFVGAWARIDTFPQYESTIMAIASTVAIAPQQN